MLRKIYENVELKIYEQSPSKRTIVIDDEKYFVQFPYIIFVIQVFFNSSEEEVGYDFYAFGSKKSIINSNCSVNILPLPNIKSNGLVCMGGYDITYKIDIKELINDFWSSKFKTNEMKEADKRWELWYYEGVLEDEDKLKNIFDVKF